MGLTSPTRLKQQVSLLVSLLFSSIFMKQSNLSEDILDRSYGLG